MVSSVVIGGKRVKLCRRLEVCFRVQRAMVSAALWAAKEGIEAALRDEVTSRLGRSRYSWRVLSESGETDWRCGRCGSRMGSDFSRDGTYGRCLVLRQGQVKDLRVPVVECQVCGSKVSTHFAVLEKHRRFWYDLTHVSLLEYGLGTSLRRIAAKLDKALGGISLSTLSGRIHSIEAGIEAWKSRPILDVPDVVQLDGIWFSRMVPTGKKRRDKRGGWRAVKRRVDRVVLVAIGIWTASGRREILDWHIASTESEEAWLYLLDRLYQRGLTAESGLKLVVHDGGGGVTSALAYGYHDVAEQRCIFHKITNVADNFSKDGGGSVREITEDASHVFAGKSKRAVKQRLWHFRKKWEDRQPKSVRSLLSDFDKTLSYFDVGIDSAQFLRTTSILERANREIRRKLAQMGVVQSEKGEQSALHLAVLAYNYYAGDDDWTDIITALHSSSLAYFPN